MSRRALLAATAGFAVVAVLATTAGPTSDATITDLPVYRDIAAILDHGQWPYENAGTEYPPIALAPMWLAAKVGGGTDGYDAAFGLLMLAAALIAFWVTVRLAEAVGGPRAGIVAAIALILSPLAVGAIARTHFDWWPAAATVAALLALARNRPRLGLALLGVGAAIKLFPALLVPLALVWLFARGERKAIWQGALAFVAVVLVVAIPFAPHGVARVVTFHLDRPVQIESTPATVMRVFGDGTVTGVAAHPDRFKSQGIVGGPADAIAAVCSLLAAALIAGIAVAVRRVPDVRGLVLCAFATLLAFVALGKVLSPQFVIWLVPFAAMAWAWREWTPAIATTLAIVLTQVEFPLRYWDLVAGDTGVVVLVGVRNVLLLIALSSLLVRVVAPVRWRRPAPVPML